MNKDDIEKLIQMHQAWRAHLLELAYSGKNNGWTDSQKVGDPTACDFGKMIQAATSISSHPLWKEILEVHKNFHTEAKVIYDLAEAQKRDQVEFLLNSSTGTFAETTFRLVNILKRLKESL